MCVCVFFFCSYLVLSASDLDRRRSLLYTYAQQQTVAPRVFSSLPSVTQTEDHAEGSLTPKGTTSALLASIRYVCAVSRIYVPGVFLCIRGF